MNRTEKAIPKIEIANLNSFVSISRRVANGLDEQAVLKGIADEARQMLQGDLALIVLPAENAEYGRIVAQSGFRSEQIDALIGRTAPLHELPAVEQLFQAGERIEIGNSSLNGETPGLELVREFDMRAVCAVPLRHEGKVIGALAVIFTGEVHDWTEAEVLHSRRLLTREHLLWCCAANYPNNDIAWLFAMRSTRQGNAYNRPPILTL